MLSFDEFARCLIYVNGSFSYLMNMLLIYLILNYSKKHMGTYRYLMLFFALFNMVYPGIHIVVMPNMHVHGYAFILFPTSLLEHTLEPAHWGMVMYGSLFCQSLVLLALHFVYRYLLICKAHLIYLFNSRRYIVMWVGIWLLMGLIWGAALRNLMFYDKEYQDYVRDVLWDTYKFDVNTSAILGLMYKRELPNGDVVWRAEELLCYFINMTQMLLTFCVIAFCTLNIFRTLKTLIPIVFEYTPCFMTFTTPLLGIPFGRGCNYVPIAISYYPILDPICIIYFIKDYRYALMSKLGYANRVDSLYGQQHKGNSGERSADLTHY